MSANSSFVEIDLYGRAFDGIFGRGAEQEGRRQALQKQKKLRDKQYAKHNKSSSVYIAHYVDLDLYGRGDPRVFGREVADLDPAKVEKPTASTIYRRALLISPHFLKTNKDLYTPIPLEPLSSSSSSNPDSAEKNDGQAECPRQKIEPLPISVIDTGSPSVGISPELHSVHSPFVDTTPRRVKSVKGNHIDLTRIESGHVVRALRSLQSASSIFGRNLSRNTPSSQHATPNTTDGLENQPGKPFAKSPGPQLTTSPTSIANIDSAPQSPTTALPTSTSSPSSSTSSSSTSSSSSSENNNGPHSSATRTASPDAPRSKSSHSSSSEPSAPTSSQTVPDTAPQASSLSPPNESQGTEVHTVANINSREDKSPTAKATPSQGLVGGSSSDNLEKGKNKADSSETSVEVTSQSRSSGTESPSPPSSSSSPPSRAPGSSEGLGTKSSSSSSRSTRRSRISRRSRELFERTAQRFRGLFRRSSSSQNPSPTREGPSSKDTELNISSDGNNVENRGANDSGNTRDSEWQTHTQAQQAQSEEVNTDAILRPGSDERLAVEEDRSRFGKRNEAHHSLGSRAGSDLADLAISDDEKNYVEFKVGAEDVRVPISEHSRESNQSSGKDASTLDNEGKLKGHSSQDENDHGHSSSSPPNSSVGGSTSSVPIAPSSSSSSSHSTSSSSGLRSDTVSNSVHPTEAVGGDASNPESGDHDVNVSCEESDARSTFENGSEALADENYLKSTDVVCGKFVSQSENADDVYEMEGKVLEEPDSEVIVLDDEQLNIVTSVDEVSENFVSQPENAHNAYQMRREVLEELNSEAVVLDDEQQNNAMIPVDDSVVIHNSDESDGAGCSSLSETSSVLAPVLNMRRPTWRDSWNRSAHTETSWHARTHAQSDNVSDRGWSNPINTTGEGDGGVPSVQNFQASLARVPSVAVNGSHSSSRSSLSVPVVDSITPGVDIVSMTAFGRSRSTAGSTVPRRDRFSPRASSLLQAPGNYDSYSVSSDDLPTVHSSRASHQVAEDFGSDSPAVRNMDSWDQEMNQEKKGTGEGENDGDSDSNGQDGHPGTGRGSSSEDWGIQTTDSDHSSSAAASSTLIPNSSRDSDAVTTLPSSTTASPSVDSDGVTVAASSSGVVSNSSEEQGEDSDEVRNVESDNSSDSVTNTTSSRSSGSN